jgi:hypothetical protein
MRKWPLALTPPALTLASALARSASRRWQSSRKALPSWVSVMTSRGAHQQLHAQAFFQGVYAPADDRRRHIVGQCGGREAALGRDRHEGFDLLEPGHGSRLCPFNAQIHHFEAT